MRTTSNRTQEMLRKVIVWSASPSLTPQLCRTGDLNALCKVDLKAMLNGTVALPAYGDLDDAVKFAERETRRHQNAPPHHGADPGQSDFDPQDRRRIRRGVSSGVGGFGRRFIWPDYRASVRSSPDIPEILMLSCFVARVAVVTGVPAGLIAFYGETARRSGKKGDATTSMHMVFGLRRTPAPRARVGRGCRKVQRDHRDPTLRALEAKAKKT